MFTVAKAPYEGLLT